ncbi:MAG TPA: hypothetical protein DEP69_07295, partial [Acidimicrobiaceae bacterium]|nr:hypothetical protein [Acidimicrobiaceae bacterium]
DGTRLRIEVLAEDEDGEAFTVRVTRRELPAGTAPGPTPPEVPRPAPLTRTATPPVTSPTPSAPVTAPPVPPVPPVPPAPPATVAADFCRIDGVNTNLFGVQPTVGFLPPAWAPATAVGTYRVVVLYVDFPNVPAASDIDDVANAGQLLLAEAYLEASSYGALDVVFAERAGWLRAAKNWQSYATDGSVNPSQIVAEAVSQADPDFDFSGGFDAVLVVLPRRFFGGGSSRSTTGTYATADGQGFGRVAVANGIAHGIGYTAAALPSPPWWRAAAHELLHTFGLPDYYPYDESRHARAPAPADPDRWVTIRFGLLGLEGYFRVADEVAAYEWRRENEHGGSSGYGNVSELEPQEMLAWSRWVLGWLDD